MSVVLRRGFDVGLGSVWLLGALSMIWGAGASELVVVKSVLGDLTSTTQALVLGLVCGIEAALGVALVRRPAAAVRLLAISFLVLLTGALFLHGLRMGWGARCGCLTLLFESSTVAGVVRNLALVLICGTGWGVTGGFRSPPEP